MRAWKFWLLITLEVTSTNVGQTVVLESEDYGTKVSTNNFDKWYCAVTSPKSVHRV
jgi:hypothetical protein